jgi:hypothetical protein
VKTEPVHFMLCQKKGDTAIATVCQPSWSQPALRSLVPLTVTCERCLDWLARNHKTAIAQVQALQGRAA